MGRSHVSARGAVLGKAFHRMADRRGGRHDRVELRQRAAGLRRQVLRRSSAEVRRAVDRAVLRRRAPGRTAPSGSSIAPRRLRFRPVPRSGFTFSTSSTRSPGATISASKARDRLHGAHGRVLADRHARDLRLDPGFLHRSKQDRLLRAQPGRGAGADRPFHDRSLRRRLPQRARRRPVPRPGVPRRRAQGDRQGLWLRAAERASSTNIIRSST